MATAVCSVLLICACESSPRTRTDVSQGAHLGDAVASEPRIYAFSDRPLVLPLSPARRAGDVENGQAAERWRPSQMPRVQYDDGAVEGVRLVYFEARPNENSDFPWLPAPATWSAIDWDATQDPNWNAAGGFWGVVVPPPPAGRRQVLRFNGAALPVIWLPGPPPATDSLRAPRLDLDRTALRALGDRLTKLAQDPLAAWRVRILTDRIRSSELWASPPAPPSDPALAALANQIEGRWRSAISAIERDNPELASEFVSRLTAVIRTPEGAALPAWGQEDSALNAVRAALLAPAGSKATREQSVRTWLAAAPAAVAWVVDDSSAKGAESRAATVTIANLQSTPVVASSAPVGKPAVNATRLPAHGSGSFTCDVDGSPEAGSGAVIARAGGWSKTLPLLASPLPVSPPGLLMGPLAPHWDMMSWMSGRAEAPEPRSVCVAMLQRSPTDAQQWTVYVECSGSESGDVVTLWFGPFEASVSELRVGPGASSGIAFHREGSRWWANVPAPSSAIESGARLRLGVTRQFDSGALWSWPRPMTPGQREPARAVVDLSGWGSLIE